MFRSALIMTLAALALACAGEPNNPPLSDEIILPGNAFYPEGIAKAGSDLYVGSLANGSVEHSTVTRADTTTLISSDAAIDQAVGLIVGDDGTLWVCSSNISTGEAPTIMGFDRSTGDLVASHAFSGNAGFCNDIAFDGDGNLYATDTLGGRVVRVAAAELLSNSEPEDWSTDPILAVPPGQFGLNGIVVDGDYVYAVTYGNGDLFRISLATGEAEAVALPAALSGADGLERLGPNKLLVVEGFLGSLTQIDVTGTSATMQTVASGFDFPSTVAVEGTTAWVVESQLDHLLGLDSDPPTTPFHIVRVDL